MCGQSLTSEAKALVAGTIPTANAMPINMVFMVTIPPGKQCNQTITINNVMAITKVCFG
jgi:hypothetical protein